MLKKECFYVKKKQKHLIIVLYHLKMKLKNKLTSIGIINNNIK